MPVHVVRSTERHLLHEDQKEREKALRDLKKWYKVLAQAESENTQKNSSVVPALLKHLIWPEMPWYRRILLSLHKVGFKKVPNDVRIAVENWAHGWQTTTCTEYAFHAVRRQETANEAGKICRGRRWLAMMDSKITDDHDRPSVKKFPQDDLSVVDGRAIKNSTFSCEGGDSSLSPEDFRHLADSNNEWRSPSNEHPVWKIVFLYFQLCCILCNPPPGSPIGVGNQEGALETDLLGSGVVGGGVVTFVWFASHAHQALVRRQLSA